jgi:hypothetical protein
MGRIAAPAGMLRKFDYGEPATRPMGGVGGGWAEPPTRPMADLTGRDTGRGRTTDRTARATDRTNRTSGTGRRTLPSTEEYGGDPPKKRSRLALQMAVQSIDNQEYAKVDLTADNRSLGRRFFKGIFYLVLFGGAVWLVVFQIVGGMRPDLFKDFYALFQPTVEEGPAPIEVEYERRKAMRPGAELLTLELEDPRNFTTIGKGDDFLAASLSALGKSAPAALAQIATDNNTEKARQRAYELWLDTDAAAEPGARLELLKRIASKKRPAEPLIGYITGALKASPPKDELIGPALEWAPKPAWRVLVERLGRDGPGAAERAKVLTKAAEKDSEDALALRSLILTGHAPQDALTRLIVQRELEWAKEEGRELLVGLVQGSLEQVESLLVHESLDHRDFGAVLLVEANAGGSNARLIKLVRDRKAAGRVRLSAINGLRKNGVAAATWNLVLLVMSKEKEPLKVAAQRALESFSGDDAVAQLKPYLDPSKDVRYRQYAIRGLGSEAINRPGLCLKELQGYLSSEAGGDSLNAGLGIYRQIARNDKDAKVRKAAKRLYDSLTGG